MLKPNIPDNEQDRLMALYAMRILDTPPEERFDRIVRLAKAIFGMPIAAVSLVDKDREWFKAADGIDITESPRDISFCGHTILESGLFQVSDASKDKRFADNPQVTGESQIRFYAGQPLHSIDGQAVGAFCLKDSKPNKLTEEQESCLKDLSRMAEDALNLVKISELQEELAEANQTAHSAMRGLDAAYKEMCVLLGSISSIMIAVNEKGSITLWNSEAEEAFGLSEKDARATGWKPDIVSWDAMAAANAVLKCQTMHEVVRVEELSYTRPDGKKSHLGISVNPITDDAGEFKGFMMIGSDIAARKKQEAESLQTQKMESIGQLACGIAHEINTPMQFIGDNLNFAQDNVDGLIKLIEKQDALLDKALSDSSELSGASKELLEEGEFEYMKGEVPSAIKQSIEGVARVSKIVRAMKDFSHPGLSEKIHTNLNQAIESTIVIARNVWKTVAKLDFNPEAELPAVNCLAGEFNQVVLNMIVNAAHAIEDKQAQPGAPEGLIEISTASKDDGVEIRISDNGCGIPAENLEKIYDPFFTTKDVGRGTGQGLSICYSMVVEKHGGRLDVKSNAGEGTVFTIWLPF